MDFDEENESDICKNCNYVSHNDSPYGEIENAHEITINAVELASELASAHLERVHTDRIVIWELSEVGESYTEEAQDIFNDLYDEYYTLIESTKLSKLPEEKPIRMKTLNVIKASRFLDWYFSDYEDLASFGLQCMEWIKKFGKTDITSEQLFEQFGGFIPQSICEYWDGDLDNEQEYEPSDIEFINDLK
jgi:hypothetical protein